MYRKIRLYMPIISLTLLMLTSCTDDEELNQVPVVPLNLSISLDLPLYAPLQNPGGWIYVDGGSMGVVVYRIGPEEFSAFDRHCTFQVENQCQIAVDEDSNVSAVDYNCCNSVFNLLDGGVMSGPARRPLRRMQTNFNVNTNTLIISN